MKNLEKPFDFSIIGFTRIPNWLIRGKFSPALKLTLIVLLSYSQDGFKTAFVKHQTLANDIKRNISSIKRYLKNLNTAGLVSWKKKGFGRYNLYAFNQSISELIERCLKSSKELKFEPSISSSLNYQSDQKQANEKKTTIENKQFKTNKEIFSNKETTQSIGHILSDSPGFLRLKSFVNEKLRNK